MTQSPGLEALLAAAAPAVPRDLGTLVDRLRVAGQAARLIGPGTAVDREPGGGSVARTAVLVRDVTSDSRAARPGSLFVAVPGARADGHDFVHEAVSAGASAVLVEREVPDVPVPQVVVPSTRPALADAAAWLYGDPSRELGVVGITGTDGKTTTSLLAAGVFAAGGLRPGLIGTVATQIGGIREPNAEHSTTPEAPVIQRALRAMVAAGDRAAIIETTSHGLALDRVAAVAYDVAIFTNLSHEHLELHGTFDAYRAAKLSLFDCLAVDRAHPVKPAVAWPRTGIVNADDPSAPVFAAATRSAGARLITFGRAEGADVRLVDVRDEAGGLEIAYRTSDGAARLRLQLAGRYNAHNALAVIALGRAIGLDEQAVVAGLAAVDRVPGRMESVVRGQPFDVVIDYAHSPASLALVLDELGPVAAARGGTLLAVFGSAGERDREKRPMLGRIAAERCRVLVLTDEDPRGEDRAAILAEIAAGARAVARRPEAILEIPDRRAAIGQALGLARPGDVVLLAGKGHEATILQASHAEPWSERAEAEAALAALGWAS